MKQQQSGFTLVEIAIVLVIIGLLLGGILKGQELIANARVRNIADQQNSVKAAFYAFQDRFRALPGDYLAAQANVNIPNTAAANGNGNSQIEAKEIAQAWHQLTASGFISCNPCAADPGDAAADANNSLTNAFNGVMGIVFDATYSDTVVATSRNNLKTGEQIPPNVLAEVDRKIDDGDPRTGSFRFSTWTASGANNPTLANCLTAGNQWLATNTGNSCGGASFF